MSEEVVFISGASRGIGTAIAEHFANKGYKVIGTSRTNFTFNSNNKKVKFINIKMERSPKYQKIKNYLLS